MNFVCFYAGLILSLMEISGKTMKYQRINMSHSEKSEEIIISLTLNL